MLNPEPVFDKCEQRVTVLEPVFVVAVSRLPAPHIAVSVLQPEVNKEAHVTFGLASLTNHHGLANLGPIWNTTPL